MHINASSYDRPDAAALIYDKHLSGAHYYGKDSIRYEFDLRG